MRGRNRREPAAAAGSERTTPRSPRWRLGCWRSMRPAGPEGRGLPRLRSLREGLARLWDARAWRPAHARLVWAQLVHRDRNRDAGLDDEAHLRAAARWLARAQDVMPDGGVAGRYRLCGGWTSSYPETTGYLIPTFQALGRALGDPRFEARAQQCVDFLLRLQLREGGSPGGEVHENTTRPSVFNTGQIDGRVVFSCTSPPGNPPSRSCKRNRKSTHCWARASKRGSPRARPSAWNVGMRYPVVSG